jgi:hypothetical protein
MLKNEMIDSRIKNNKLSELKLKDISGKIFGKLTVIKKHEKRSHNNKILWECLCECGNKCIIAGNQLNRGARGGNGIPTKSCGCLRNNAHNKIKDREIAMWRRLYNSTVIKRSKKSGYNSDITYEKFLELSKSECYYCGLKDSNYYKDTCESSNFILYYNGLDRSDSNIGYYLNNVVSCCKYCNCAKNTMSRSEFMNFIKRVYDFNFTSHN